MDLDLCYMPAVEALSLFKDRRLSPVELLNAQIERAEAVEPAVNAFSDIFFDAALKAARRAEIRYTQKGKRLRPLEGLTVAVKEDINIKGQRTTMGSLVYKDRIAADTHPVCERLLRAGAIVHARTTCSEFTSAYTTHSRLNGVTATPWDTRYTCCGSSGGSGASLAAGTTSLATGSDIGGSIRGPAAACGVVGFKPPYGRVPAAPPSNLDWYYHVGPMARTVADCALMQNVISGVHPKDIATLRQKVNLPQIYPGIAGWRIAYSLDIGNGVLASEVEKNTLQTLDVLRDLGATVEAVDLDWGPEVTGAAAAYMDHLFGRTLAREYEQHPDLLCDYTTYYAKAAGACDAETFLWTYEVAGNMYATLGPLLERYHAFICPTLVTHEVRADQEPWEMMTVRGVDIDTNFDWVLMHPFNILSRLPVLAVPSGIAANGLPTGIQIVARSYDDKRVFQLASTLEKARPWMDTPARRPAL